MDVFFTKEDRLLYLDTLKTHAASGGLEILSWCLMTNHVHLVVVPTCEESMAHAIGETHRLYTRYLNFREGVRGHLFQERFFSCPLDEEHFVGAVRYVERNPVRAGMVTSAVDYPWSSAAFRTDTQVIDPLVTQRFPFGLNLEWESLLAADPRSVSVLRNRTRTGRPLGMEHLSLKPRR